MWGIRWPARRVGRADAGQTNSRTGVPMMTAVKMIPALLLGVAVVGCQAEVDWSQAGLSSVRVSRDQKDCAREARGYGALRFDDSTIVGSQSRGLVKTRTSARERANFHRLCMNQRGYTKSARGVRASGAGPGN